MNNSVNERYRHFQRIFRWISAVFQTMLSPAHRSFSPFINIHLQLSKQNHRHVRPCIESEHSARHLAIFQQSHCEPHRIYEYEPRTRIHGAVVCRKRGAISPYWVRLMMRVVLLGFATYGVFRSKPACKCTIEHSIYNHHEHRGKASGALLEPLIRANKAQDYHCMVGAIDGQIRPASIYLQFGFTYAGTIHQAGFKFGSGWIWCWSVCYPHASIRWMAKTSVHRCFFSQCGAIRKDLERQPCALFCKASVCMARTPSKQTSVHALPATHPHPKQNVRDSDARQNRRQRCE